MHFPVFVVYNILCIINRNKLKFEIYMHQKIRIVIIFVPKRAFDRQLINFRFKFILVFVVFLVRNNIEYSKD